MSKHIGAPWNFDADGIIIDNTGRPIMRGDLTEEEFAARGNVTCAAPKLLAACEAYISVIDMPIPDKVADANAWADKRAEAVQQIRDAIVEAKGINHE